MIDRLSVDEWGLRLAEITATRGTCLRRNVGCVLLDERGHVLATGYNGVAAGQPHCNASALSSEVVDVVLNDSDRTRARMAHHPHACPGAGAPSGTNLAGCEAIHAEANALLQCRDVGAVRTCYTTVSPCTECIKLLMNSGCTRIVFRNFYAHRTMDYWTARPHPWLKVPRTYHHLGAIDTYTLTWSF